MRQGSSARLWFPLMIALAPSTLMAEMKGPYFQAVQGITLEKPFVVAAPLKTNNMICLVTPDNSDIVGLAHDLQIHASIDKIAEVFEDFDHYPEVFNSLEKTKLTQRKDKEFHVDFESPVPIPFVPNTKYSMIYKIIADKSKDKTKAYKAYSFTLNTSKDLKSLDGIAVIWKVDAENSLYQEIDFLDANWGVAKSLAPKAIWKSSVEGMINSDFAMKFKAERPALSSKEVKKQADDAVDGDQVKDCIQHKRVAGEYLDFLSHRLASLPTPVPTVSENRR